jgi:hypothetical protein
VADGAGDRRAIRLVAVDASLHLHRHESFMARLAIRTVPGMTKKHEVRKHANRLFRHDPPAKLEFRVARLTLGNVRKRSALPDFMAGDTLHFQKRMLFVIELNGCL